MTKLKLSIESRLEALEKFHKCSCPPNPEKLTAGRWNCPVHGHVEKFHDGVVKYYSMGHTGIFDRPEV